MKNDAVFGVKHGKWYRFWSGLLKMMPFLECCFKNDTNFGVLISKTRFLIPILECFYYKNTGFWLSSVLLTIVDSQIIQRKFDAVFGVEHQKRYQFWSVFSKMMLFLEWCIKNDTNFGVFFCETQNLIPFLEYFC